MINSLILHCYENDYSSAIYMGFQYLGVLAQLGSLLLCRKAYGFSFKRALVLFFLIYPLLFFSIYFITWVEYGFTNWGANNTIRVYMWTPLMLLPYAKLLKIPHAKLCDYFAPTFTLAFGIGHIGCIFQGCCHGYPCSWGIYNPELHQRLFPIQLVESFVSLFVSYCLLRYARKKGYECRGKVMALFMILAGLSRFVLEFFRDNLKLFWGISELALWAFITFLTGCVMMLVISKSSKKAK